MSVASQFFPKEFRTAQRIIMTYSILRISKLRRVIVHKSFPNFFCQQPSNFSPPRFPKPPPGKEAHDKFGEQDWYGFFSKNEYSYLKRNGEYPDWGDDGHATFWTAAGKSSTANFTRVWVCSTTTTSICHPIDTSTSSCILTDPPRILHPYRIPPWTPMHVFHPTPCTCSSQCHTQ